MAAGVQWRRVGTGVSQVARLRGVELSLDAYRRLAVATAVMLVVIVATGATVRLTGSGLGCEHWPGCTGTVKLPEKGYHSFIEFSNRIVASLTTIVALAAWLGARFAGAPNGIRRLGLVTFLGVVAQGALGAITVLSHLNPYIVLTHLLLSLAVLSVGIVLALEATALVRGRDRPSLPSVGAAGGVRPGARARRARRLRARWPLRRDRTRAAFSCGASGRSSRRSTGTCVRPRCSGSASRCFSSGSCGRGAVICAGRCSCSVCSPCR